jgi:hypothetical protein
VHVGGGKLRGREVHADVQKVELAGRELCAGAPSSGSEQRGGAPFNMLRRGCTYRALAHDGISQKLST